MSGLETGSGDDWPALLRPYPSTTHANTQQPSSWSVVEETAWNNSSEYEVIGVTSTPHQPRQVSDWSCEYPFTFIPIQTYI